MLAPTRRKEDSVAGDDTAEPFGDCPKADRAIVLALVRATLVDDRVGVEALLNPLTDVEARRLVPVMAGMCARLLIDASWCTDRRRLADDLSRQLVTMAQRDCGPGGE
jgi:hypothetical protein